MVGEEQNLFHSFSLGFVCNHIVSSNAQITSWHSVRIEQSGIRNQNKTWTKLYQLNTIKKRIQVHLPTYIQRNHAIQVSCANNENDEVLNPLYKGSPDTVFFGRVGDHKKILFFLQIS